MTKSLMLSDEIPAQLDSIICRLFRRVPGNIAELFLFQQAGATEDGGCEALSDAIRSAEQPLFFRMEFICIQDGDGEELRSSRLPPSLFRTDGAEMPSYAYASIKLRMFLMTVGGMDLGVTTADMTDR
jgi:hypothetical protein